MRTHRLPLLVAAFTLAGGCSGSDGPGPGPTEPEVGPPANVAAVGASDRQATAGGTVSDSLAVRVTDARGKPVGGATVAWAVAAGGGSVNPASTRTDAAGVAKTAWTLGTSAGENAATASVGALPAVRFTATGSAGAAAGVAKASGDSQAGTVGSALPQPLVVRVTDANGNPVAGVPVTWTVASGGGSVAPTAPATNAAGEASAVWTLGTAAGGNSVTASAGGSAALTFAATAAPGAPASLERLGGNAQIGTVGAVLANPLSVRVTDRYGNTVGGVPVAWETTAGGQLSPVSVATDANGVAVTRWKLGPTFGSQSASALVGGALRADFAATADPVYPGRAAPVQLTLGGTTGRTHFDRGNTAQGGQGEPIGGLSCIRDENDIAYHEHAHVSLFVEGEQIAIPAAVGITEFVMDPRVGDGFVVAGRCYYWMHTHDATGIVHVEPPTMDRLTLGQLFDLWGRPLARDNVAGFRGPVTVYVDGELFRGDPRTIPFTQHGHISLQVGTTLAPIPQYTFPAGY